MPVQKPTSSQSRRSFLTSIGAAAGGLSLGSMGGRARLEDNYRTVVDLVDAGADNMGDTSVTPVIEDVIDDDTLLRFPPGRYYMDSQVRFTGFENVGLVGEDATLVPANYHDFEGPKNRLFRLGVDYSPGGSIHVENFTIDQRAPDTGIRAFELTASDRLVVRNVHVAGYHDSGTWGPALFRLTESDGVGLVEEFKIPDGAALSSETPGSRLWRGPTGILVNGHRGSLRFYHCVVNGFPDQGLYVTGTGEFTVYGGAYRNSGTSNVRIGTDRATVNWATLVVDDDNLDYAAQVPIWVDRGSWIEIRNSDISMPSPNGAGVLVQSDVDGALLTNTELSIGAGVTSGVVIQGDTGPVYLRGVDVASEASGNAIRILGADGGEVGIQGGRISGGASGTVLRHAIRAERDGTEIRHVEIDQWGDGKRRGLALVGDDAYVNGCSIGTTDRPVTVRGDSAWIEDCWLNSYSGDESILLADSVQSVRLKNNGFPDGIADRGATGVLETGTTA